MERREFDDGRRRRGTVKAAIDVFGKGIINGTPSLENSHIDFQEESSSRTRELHVARRDASRYRERRRTAESLKAATDSKLSSAKGTVKDLSSMIEESSSNTKAQMKTIESLRKSRIRGKMAIEKPEPEPEPESESYRYAEVMRELELVKQEMSNLKLEMASVMEQKAWAEKEIKSSNLKLETDLTSVEMLRSEIEVANEEQVLVELARMEALKEYREMEAQIEKESSEFSFIIEDKKNKAKDLIEEIDESKELENKLALTLSDITVLRNELALVKEMDRRVQRNDSLNRSKNSLQRREEERKGSITEKLEAAKNELALIKEEGFQFMTSMDIVRTELIHVREESTRLKKIEEKADSKVQNLNSKLLRAKLKLEALSSAEEKAKSIVNTLSISLEQLKTERKATESENALISEETAVIKAEIQRTDAEIDLTEEKLELALQELEAVKSSEASTLNNLESVIENTIRSRASISQRSSTISISKFEYEYLIGRAAQAEKVADKKVAASEAWIEALKASEKEIVMKTELGRVKTLENNKAVVDSSNQQAYTMARSESVKRMVEDELQNWRENSEKNERLPRKSKGNSDMTPSRRAKFRKFSSPETRGTGTPSGYFTIKKKRKPMPSIVKLFTRKAEAV